MATSVTPTCPKCKSQLIWKAGYYRGRQRWSCRGCGFRFSESIPKAKIEFNITSQISEFPHSYPQSPKNSVRRSNITSKEPSNGFSLSHRKDIGPQISASTPLGAIVAQDLNALLRYSSTRQVGAIKEKAKNLAEEATIKTRLSAAATVDINGKIVEFAWWMHKEGYAKETIRGYQSCLRALMVRNADLMNPESVKEALANERNWSPNRRRNVINSYTVFLKYNGLLWDKPRCQVQARIPFIPKEEELDALIAGCGKKTSTFLQLLKETVMRSGEAKRLLWTNIDSEKHLITLNEPEKGSSPRIWKVSQKLMGMLDNLPRDTAKIFGDGPIKSMRATFIKGRRRLAAKLENPRLLQITFHTFRHWKATMLYHQTKDPYYVKNFLGHKSLRSTEIYINIEHAIFEPSNEEFTVKIAINQEEIKSLLEAGFDYVCERDGMMFLRKRK